MKKDNQILWCVKFAHISIDSAFVTEEDEVTDFVYAENCDEAYKRSTLGKSPELYVTRCFPL